MKKRILTTVAIILGIVIGAALKGALFKTDEREYVLILRFGQIMQVHYEPGLGVKAPFIDTIQRIDKRTLRADIPPRAVPDRDRERLTIDNVVRYKIVDPVAFRVALRNEETAFNRIQTVMYSAMRDTVATRDRTEIIGARPLHDEQGNPISNDEGVAGVRIA